MTDQELKDVLDYLNEAIHKVKDLKSKIYLSTDARTNTLLKDGVQALEAGYGIVGTGFQMALDAEKQARDAR